MDVGGNLVETIFHRKMTGIESVQFGVRQVFEVCLSAFAREKDVVLAPENQRPGLVFSKETLPLGIQIDVRSIVVEKIHLNATRVWSFDKTKVHIPIVGAD